MHPAPPTRSIKSKSEAETTTVTLVRGSRSVAAGRWSVNRDSSDCFPTINVLKRVVNSDDLWSIETFHISMNRHSIAK